MNLDHIRTVYLKELKDSLRDRRTLMSMIIVPTLVMPVLIFGVGAIMSKVISKAQADVAKVMIVGGADSPGIRAGLEAKKDENGENHLFQVVPTDANYQQLISDKKIRAALEVPPGFEAGLKSGQKQALTIYYYKDELNSTIAVRRLEDFLSDLREKTVSAVLKEKGLSDSLTKPFESKRQNVAAPEKVGGNTFGGIIPYIIIILCFTGAMYPAMDLTAGEKERGTMETLLCSPASRLDIVLGKFFMILTASITTMLLSLISLGVSFILGGSIFGGRATEMAKAAKSTGEPMLVIAPEGLLGVFAMVAPVAVFFAAILLAISLFAKSYKEAQSYVSPLIIVVIMPAVVGMLPGIELDAKTALIPILSLSLVCKEMLSGVWHWNYIALIFGSTCLYASVALAFAVRMFNREDVLFRA